jgi:hypothetical protein
MMDKLHGISLLFQGVTPKIKTLGTRNYMRPYAVIALLVVTIVSSALHAQKAPPIGVEPIPAPADPRAVIVPNPAAQCVQPAPLLQLQDYNGPFAKTVGFFAARSERKSVHPPHYKPGVRLCSLDVRDKLVLFVEDAFDPVTFISAGFDAGIAQAANWDPSFGQGGAGYGKRFGASYADQTSSLFFKDFFYPTIFSEDPRYYRQVHGSGGKRLWHAFNHAFIADRDDGSGVFNFSEWLGTTSSEILANTYHPGNGRGAGAVSEQVGIDIAQDIGFDILREFWPELARKLRLPFREERETPVPPGPNPQ